jgi:hypothetical protein
MSRYGSSHGAGPGGVDRRRPHAPRGDPKHAWRCVDLAQLAQPHAVGHDHIVGAGGTPAELAPRSDRMVALADGTRIAFTTTGVIPQFQSVLDET